MPDFAQQRHKPPVALQRPRELLLACPPMRSNVNLSRIVRAAACCGIPHMICCGNARILPEISRHPEGHRKDSGDSIQIEIHRTLPPVIKRLKVEGYPIVGLEQASNSTSIFEFQFPRKVVLVVGNERLGIEDEVLRLWTARSRSPSTGFPTPTTWLPPRRLPFMSIAGSIRQGEGGGWKQADLCGKQDFGAPPTLINNVWNALARRANSAVNSPRLAAEPPRMGLRRWEAARMKGINSCRRRLANWPF